jgi:predicted DNA-binding transcriptional regulator YafY
VSALGDATAAFAVDGPRIDADTLATMAGACRDGLRLRFAYTARDDTATRRQVEPAAVVYSGYRWYLVAHDLNRDDWRTFRVDRIRSRVTVGERGRRRTVPGGDPAAYVRQQLRGGGESDAVPGRVRIARPASEVDRRVPSRYAIVAPDGDAACIVTTRGRWSREFLVWIALLDEPMEILDPPELVEAARATAARLGAAA